MRLTTPSCATFLAALMIGCSTGRHTGVLVFQSNRDGNFEIYTMREDGSALHRITNNPANDISPSWSPDGSTIVFASDRTGNWEVFSVRADGSNLLQLTRGEGANSSPSWTAGGRKILFVSTRDMINGDLYLMNNDGSNVERITNDSLVKDTPLMTPDGKMIIMTVNTRGRYFLASYNPASRAVTALTTPAEDCMSPALSPDGTRLAFVSNREGNFKVFTMDLGGNQRTRITNNRMDDSHPSWTTNPNEIILSRTGGIVLLSLDTKTERMLSYKGDSSPQWRPE